MTDVTLYDRDPNYIPRVAAVHDMCGYGKCSLTAAIPILSAAGCDVCPVPTALFSAHTRYAVFTFHDTTDILFGYLDAWQKEDVELDGVYSGFLGSPDQVAIIQRLYREYPNALRLVDPVMGDAGEMYPTYTPELCEAMGALADGADVLMPNLTEASILTKRDYPGQDIDEATVNELLGALLELGAKNVVLKGIEGDVRPYNGTDYTYYGVADCEIVENEDGTVDYNITLKPGVKFSDGTEMTIDDVIFSYYVLLDPTYDGVSTLYSIPIKGLDAYRSGMDSRMNLILAAGPDGYTATDFFTEDQYNTFWAAFNAAGVKFAQEILDYVVPVAPPPVIPWPPRLPTGAMSWPRAPLSRISGRPSWLSTAMTSPITASTPRPPAPASPPSSRLRSVTPSPTTPSACRPVSPLPTSLVSSRPAITA